jgi:7-cyano-7-deazaguanine synthase in queuosine biosynthesis
MRVTVVPNRNAIMLAVAFGVAAAEWAEAVAAAVYGSGQQSGDDPPSDADPEDRIEACRAHQARQA